MTDAQLQGFRGIAAAMGCDDQSWQWIGPYMSQRHFGISEERAKAYQAKHGGEARQVTHASATFSAGAL